MSPHNEPTPAFYLPSRSKSYSHRVSNNPSGSVPGGIHERTTLSLILDRRPAADAKDGALSPEVRLRGGAGQHWAGKFEWLNTNKGLKKTTLGKNEVEQGPSRVTHKGKEIGLPQPAPAINLLPPVSKFAREPEVHAASSTARSPFASRNDADDSLASEMDEYPGTTYLQEPLQPLPQALLPTQSRPTTTNPFAGVYGNPYAIRTGPPSLSVDYELAGSLVDRPSALDGLQTGYSSRLGVSRRNSPWPDRKWGALSPLPPGEEGNETDDESFNTEQILASLRPERLSLYHIATPVRSSAGSATSRDAAAATTEWPSQAVPASTRGLSDHDAVAAPDACSIRTRDWDLRSCNTTELGIDNRRRQQEERTRRSVQHTLLQEQQLQFGVHDDEAPACGLPQEDAINPESWFYAEMIEIVNDYHEQLQRVVQRAYEAGQISEEQWVREKWTNRMALDRKLRVAEDMSGYKILTNEHDIKQTIQQPTGYAIYSSLLKIRDPETWQRVFEPTTTYSHLGTIMSTSQQSTPAPMNTFMWLLYKIARGLRFMLAVPDDPDLKTCSSRHPPAPDTVTYHSNVGVLGPNIPSRPPGISGSILAEPATTLQSSPSREFVPYDQPRPSTQTERTPKLSTDTTRVNNNTTFTGITLVSPLNGRTTFATRGRGYDQGAFVTNLAPSITSKKSEKMIAGYGAGKLERAKKATDDGTEVTAWPEADC